MNALLQDLFNGDTRALARVITKVENRSEDSPELLKLLFPHTGRARIIGITGSPGAGKSSLVDRLTVDLRQKNESVAVVAVDPSSPFSGGAILGDRIRMQTLGTDPGVFIRSMATRGHLGGIAAATSDVISVLDAAGKDPILVETVGVGQDEIEIVRHADVSIVVLVPGMGDDIQAIKAGIMEIGDIFVINKSDRPGVEKMETAVAAMLQLAHRPDRWMPPIVKTSATKGTGIGDLLAEIDRCFAHFQNGPIRAKKKVEAARQRLLAVLEEQLLKTVLTTNLPREELDRIALEIANRHTDPYTEAGRILKAIYEH